MNQTNLIIFSIIFQIILVFIIFSSAFVSAESKFFSALNKIPSTAYIITGVSILLTYLTIKTGSLKDACTFGFNVVDRAEKNIYESLVKYYDDVPNFVNELDFPIFRSQTYKYDPKPNTPKQENIENYISGLIFQGIEDYIVSSSLTDLSDKEWFIMFLGWFQSEKLKDQWKHEYINYAEYTNRYINRLLRFSEENQKYFDSAENINKVSGDFVLSKEYLKILDLTDKYNVHYNK